MTRAVVLLAAALAACTAYAKDERQWTAQQDRMIACNKEGRDRKLHGAQRKEFIRGCLKGDTAASGGGR